MPFQVLLYNEACDVVAHSLVERALAIVGVLAQHHVYGRDAMVVTRHLVLSLCFVNGKVLYLPFALFAKHFANGCEKR